MFSTIQKQFEVSCKIYNKKQIVYCSLVFNNKTPYLIANGCEDSCGSSTCRNCISKVQILADEELNKAITTKHPLFNQ